MKSSSSSKPRNLLENSDEEENGLKLYKAAKQGRKRPRDDNSGGDQKSDSESELRRQGNIKRRKKEIASVIKSATHRALALDPTKQSAQESGRSKKVAGPKSSRGLSEKDRKKLFGQDSDEEFSEDEAKRTRALERNAREEKEARDKKQAEAEAETKTKTKTTAKKRKKGSGSDDASSSDSRHSTKKRRLDLDGKFDRHSHQKLKNVARDDDDDDNEKKSDRASTRAKPSASNWRSTDNETKRKMHKLANIQLRSANRTAEGDDLNIYPRSSNKARLDHTIPLSKQTLQQKKDWLNQAVQMTRSGMYEDAAYAGLDPTSKSRNAPSSGLSVADLARENSQDSQDSRPRGAATDKDRHVDSNGWGTKIKVPDAIIKDPSKFVPAPDRFVLHDLMEGGTGMDRIQMERHKDLNRKELDMERKNKTGVFAPVNDMKTRIMKYTEVNDIQAQIAQLSAYYGYKAEEDIINRTLSSMFDTLASDPRESKVCAGDIYFDLCYELIPLLGQRPSYQQWEFLNALFETCIAHIYGKDFRSKRGSLLELFQRYSFYFAAVLTCPRRFGKTSVVSFGSGIIMYVAPGVKIVIYATTVEVAGNLVIKIKTVVHNLPNADSRIVRDDTRKLWMACIDEKPGFSIKKLKSSGRLNRVEARAATVHGKRRFIYFIPVYSLR